MNRRSGCSGAKPIFSTIQTHIVDFSLLYIGKSQIIVTHYAVTAYQLKQTL